MDEALKLEHEIAERAGRLAELRRRQGAPAIPDYAFHTATGEARLSSFFTDQERLLVIHNMGAACRYCTLWADGLNGLLPHLEDAMAVVFVSKDPPAAQRRMALDRGWRFRMASHLGGAYMVEQCGMAGHENMPGAAVYERESGTIRRRGRTVFGPGDLYSPVWHLLSLGGVEHGDWTPQFSYWRAPDVLEDGGENVKP